MSCKLKINYQNLLLCNNEFHTFTYRQKTISPGGSDFCPTSVSNVRRSVVSTRLQLRMWCFLNGVWCCRPGSVFFWGFTFQASWCPPGLPQPQPPLPSVILHQSWTECCLLCSHRNTITSELPLLCPPHTRTHRHFQTSCRWHSCSVEHFLRQN